MKRTDLVRGAAVFLIATFALGVAMRWLLAGVAWPVANFSDWRHAHSHTGFFGVLFPLAWVAADRSGMWTPGPRQIRFYFAS